MEKLFIEVKSKVKIKPKGLEKLPKVALAATVQFIEQMKEVKKLLGDKAVVMKGKQEYPGQVLGCDASAIKESKYPVLYIGDGKFHTVAIQLATKKDVYVLNPYSGIVEKLKKKDVEEYEKKQNAGLVKFHASDKIGVIVSTKPGQKKLEEALELKKKFKDKECYIMITDNLDFTQLENFNFIQCWVNTACPRMMDDFDKTEKKIVNIDDLLDKN